MELFQYLNYACVYFVAVFVIKVIWSRRKKVIIVLKTLKRDVTFAYVTFGSMLPAWTYKRLTNETVFKSFDSRSKRMFARTCFYYEEEKWTYQQVQTISLQVANYFQAQGYRKGDVIGLAMQNRPEVICIWLGLSRIGVTTALINFNIRGDALNHCVVTACCKAVIFGSELREAFKEIWTTRQQSDKPQQQVDLYELDRYLDALYPISHKSSIQVERKTNSGAPGEFKTHDFSTCLRTASSKPIKLTRREDQPDFMDPFLYIFTSGTTGMPKAAKSTHARLHMLGQSYKMLKLTDDDVTYCPLPLYHTFALSGVIFALAHGIPLVIVPKFSASKFWSDIHYYKVTTCLYMGELCRFIVNQPVQAELECNHRLRNMFGCGVKPEVWETFIKRYNVKRFVESYGSTEGNCTIVNLEGTKIGAIGYIPLLVQPFYSLTIVKVDEITGEIIRDKKTGRAIQCKDYEAGEMVAKIVNFFPSLRYEGYTNDDANEKKIARNMFRTGDRYFRSGDIVVRDDHGYFFFKDRIGDTFRWKGENVSTAEVEGLILRLTDMKTTIVYGVKIPGTEGRAGMASIYDPDCCVNLERLADGIEKGLPPYARPIFIRLIRGDNVVNMTGTFKLQKFNLQKEGFYIEHVSDPIYIFNAKQRTYERLDAGTYKQIMHGNFRV